MFRRLFSRFLKFFRLGPDRSQQTRPSAPVDQLVTSPYDLHQPQQTQPSVPVDEPVTSPYSPCQHDIILPNIPDQPVTPPSSPHQSQQTQPSVPVDQPVASPSSPHQSLQTQPSVPVDQPVTSPSSPHQSQQTQPSVPVDQPVTSPSDPHRSHKTQPSVPVDQPVISPSSQNRSQQTQPSEPQVFSENVFLDLTTRIGDKWTELAIRLGFRDAEIEHLQADHPHSQQRRAFKMLKTWWQRWDHLHDDGGIGAVNALCDALREIGRNDLLLFVKGYVEGAGHFDPDPYRAEFIRYYQDEMSVVPLLPWLPSEVRMVNDIYVKLKLQERENKARKVKQQTIDSHKMFQLKYKDGKPVRFILLSGIAGSGKTTIVSKIATDWALQTLRSTSSLSNFAFLVALSMRELKGVPDLTEAIFDQILAKDTKLDRKSLTTYLSSHAEEVLVVLDGADEYYNEGSQLPSKCFITDIIRNKILRGCTVLVTTRPHMVDKLCGLNHSFIHIETRGFSDLGVKEYIQKFFKGEDPKVSVGLFGYLKASGTLLSLANTPIMLLLMCLVWSDEQKLPETLTELFKEALLFILKRHFQKSGLPNPEDKELLENQLTNLLQTLGKEALNGLMLPGQKLVFEAGDFWNSLEVDKACKIGILSKEKIRSKSRAVERVTFFHKTFQEAIAGFYWASLVESDDELFESYLSKVDKSNAFGMRYLMCFCCGWNVKAAESLLRYVETFGLKTEVRDFPDIYYKVFQHPNEHFRKLWMLMHFEARSKELHSIAGIFNQVFLVEMNCGNDFTSALKFLVECATSSVSRLRVVYLIGVSLCRDSSPSLAEQLKSLKELNELKLSFRKRSCSEDIITLATDVLPSLCNLRVLQLVVPENSSLIPEAFLAVIQWIFQGTRYYVHSVPMAWAQAKEFCQKMGGNLLMPKSSEENAFANSLLEERGATTAWLNCHRFGQWLCEVDGVTMWPPFNNPDPDQPTLDGNCLTMKAEDGKWRHTYCDLKATTVCEREATVQQASLAMYCMTIGADGRPYTDGQCVHKP
ncbi:protein NLRC5-like [Patiria miniata]|uniref:Uncharacterized protein n=1 Tax=Patiria miniata TaxID=46514 RepID=A0A914ATU7_PATMI|nr:protein NLRC5-like [Patiria miniata]